MSNDAKRPAIASDGGHNRLGKVGEDAAALFLQQRGVTVRERNFRLPIGEIDIIGEYGELIIFAEVKTRSGKRYGRAGAAVDFRKQQKIIATAQIYLQRENLSNRPCRFDVIEVYPLPNGRFQIEPIAGAFEA